MNEHLREENFLPYLDARLHEAERGRLEAHLAACAACRAQLEELRALLGVLGEWKAVEPSPAFEAALRARLAAEPERSLRWVWLRPAFAGTLAAAVLLAGVWLLRQSPSSSPTPTQPVAQAPAPQPSAPAPRVTTSPAPTSEPQAAPANTLAVLENPAALENYEMLEQFDVLFEPAGREERPL